MVEILPDGRERPVQQPAKRWPRRWPSHPRRAQPADLAAASLAPRTARPKTDADYARAIRAATKLTQAEFAARIGVPIETVRNWEQGKRSPRGPARALLKVIEQAPDLAFAALAPSRARP